MGLVHGMNSNTPQIPDFPLSLAIPKHTKSVATMATITVRRSTARGSIPPVGTAASSKEAGRMSTGRNSNKIHQIGLRAMFSARMIWAIGMNANQGKLVFVFLAMRKSMIAGNR